MDDENVVLPQPRGLRGICLMEEWNMALASEKFQTIFGFDMTRKVTEPFRRIQRGVVRSKLVELAAEIQHLDSQIALLAGKYADGASPVSFAEATGDLMGGQELDAKLHDAEVAFSDAVQIANGCQFMMESEVRCYLPTEEAAKE